MGRKSPSYHGDSDKGTGSYRPGSVTSSELSDVSSLSKKSSAPKIVAVVIVSLAIVAILVGVTVYLIDTGLYCYVEAKCLRPLPATLFSFPACAVQVWIGSEITCFV